MCLDVTACAEEKESAEGEWTTINFPGRPETQDSIKIPMYPEWDCHNEHPSARALVLNSKTRNPILAQENLPTDSVGKTDLISQYSSRWKVRKVRTRQQHSVSSNCHKRVAIDTFSDAKRPVASNHFNAGHEHHKQSDLRHSSVSASRRTYLRTDRVCRLAAAAAVTSRTRRSPSLGAAAAPRVASSLGTCKHHTIPPSNFPPTANGTGWGPSRHSEVLEQDASEDAGTLPG